MPSSKSSQAKVKTRRAILNLLKMEGPTSSVALAEHFGVTPMAIRQHLYDLMDEKLVDYIEEGKKEGDSSGKGRPAKQWKLTDKSREVFPDAHAELATHLIDLIKNGFGEKGLEKMLQSRTAEQIGSYRKILSKSKSLKKSLQLLSSQRTKEGYMADVIDQGKREYLLVENHCPICAAASSCQGLCQMELDVFRSVLGNKVKITREEHIISGARRCAYRVSHGHEDSHD